MIELPAPIGYVHLRHAVDAVGRAMFGAEGPGICCQDWLKHLVDVNDPGIDAIITVIAERCESGQLAAAYQDLFKGADDLDRSVWRLAHWRNYFSLGTIDVELPLLADDGKPEKSGRTVRCTRLIYVRREGLMSLLVSMARPLPQKPKQHAGAPEQYDWDDIEQFIRREFGRRGDFAAPENRVRGWRSQNDLIELIKDYLQRRSEKIPGATRMKTKVGEILATVRSELAAGH